MQKNYNQILGSFFRKYEIKQYKKGEIIISSGDKVEQVGFIKGGHCRAFLVDKQGNELTLPLLKPVFYVTVVNAIFNKKTYYTLEALNNCEIWWAPTKEFADYFSNKPKEKMEIAQQMIWGFGELIIGIQRLMASDSYERVTYIIHFLFRNFGQMEGPQKQLKVAIPHRIISSMTGLSRETVTLQILKMVKRGIISTTNRRIALVNEKKLEAVAGTEV